ncbi:CvpA family protein [Sphingobium sufflavum]|uniref:CvpA family protein n=1 Tax=Sphingobium sufflavum TaxID=1129547 RepID=UPI001F4009C7|nr:CvpA family protein [Sphingobium sufflavum]MCE7797630.1 CvpA family protein [Sphingobium sufflavum]
MTAMDIIVLLLMGGNGILGFRRGLVCEVLSMVGLAVAMTAVRLFHAPVAEMLTGFVGTEGGAALLGLILVFGITWFVGRFAAQRIGGAIKTSLLGPVDRVLGFGFGALKGLLIATVAFVGFAMVYDTFFGEDTARPDWMRHSRTYPLLNASGRAMSEWLAERRVHGGLMGPVSVEDAGDAANEGGGE